MEKIIMRATFPHQRSHHCFFSLHFLFSSCYLFGVLTKNLVFVMVVRTSSHSCKPYVCISVSIHANRWPRNFDTYYLPSPSLISGSNRTQSERSHNNYTGGNVEDSCNNSVFFFPKKIQKTAEDSHI